jgi:branched-chain amino acid transport system substrate-binding protein
MYHIIKILIFSIIALPLLNGCGDKTETKPNNNSVKIGIIVPLEGKDSAMGDEAIKGLKILQKAAPLTSDGTKIELVYKDNRSDPNLTLKRYKELALNKEIKAIVVIAESTTLLKIADIADGYRTPTLNMFATHPGISKKSRYISSICFNNTHQGQVAALYIRDDLLLDRAAIFYDQENPYSATLSREFKKKFKSIEGEVVDMLPGNLTGEKLKKELELLRNEKTDVLYMTQNINNVFEVLKEVKKMNWDVIMMSRDGLLSRIKSKHKEMIRLADGLLTTDHFSNSMPLSDLGTEIVEKYIDNIDGVTNFAALSGEGYLLLKHSLEQCADTFEKECINANMRNVDQFKGFTGDFDISKGNAMRPVIISRIKKGKMIFIVKIY